MLKGSALRRALADLQPEQARGTGYRMIDVQYHAKPLSSEGSRKKSGRFHVKGECDALYMALDPVVALAETEYLLYVEGRLVVQPANPRTLFSIHFELPRTLDLCKPNVQGALQLTMAELTAMWRRSTKRNPAPTQLLGYEAASTQIQGLKYPSKASPGGVNLVVFTTNLSKGQSGSLRVQDDTGRLAHTLP